MCHFGLSSASDIDNEIFKALSFVGEGAGGFFAGLLDKAGDFTDDIKLGGLGFAAQYGMKKWKETRLKKSKSLFICFDDLERWVGEIDVCMSYINKLVEHDGVKCLMIGNVRKISGQKAFLTTFDKVIGYKYTFTHTAREVMDAAFGVAGVGNAEVRDLLMSIYKQNQKRIDYVLERTYCYNIRIIANALANIETIAGEHLEMFKSNTAHATEYICAMLASQIMVSMYCNSDEDIALSWVTLRIY